MVDRRSGYRQVKTGPAGSRAETLRRQILSLRGILSASVVVDDEGVVSGINLIAESDGRSRQQLARDVISLLFVQTGTRLATDDVDVVFSHGSDLLGPTDARPRLISLETGYGKDSLSVKVTLSMGSRQAEAVEKIEVTGAVGTRILPVAGRATLKAAQDLLDDRCQLVLEDLATMDVAGEQIVILAVSTNPDLAGGILVGAVRFRGDYADAGARAALDAINRTFSF